MSPSDPALGDPFFSELRQRHPDVDVVLLPPADSAPPDLDPAGEGRCRAVQRHTDAVVATVAERLGIEPGPRVDFWWQQRHPLVHRWVSRAAFPGLDGHGVETLRALARSLLDLGWDARPEGDDPPRLRAVAGAFELIGTAQPDALTVEVVSEPLHVPSAVLTALARTEGDG